MYSLQRMQYALLAMLTLLCDKLSAALEWTIAEPAMAARRNEQGIEPYFLSPEMTAKMARTDREKWAKVIVESGVKID